MTDLIERELSLPGTPAQLWPALTDPEWLGCWLADEVKAAPTLPISFPLAQSEPA